MLTHDDLSIIAEALGLPELLDQIRSATVLDAAGVALGMAFLFLLMVGASLAGPA